MSANSHPTPDRSLVGMSDKAIVSYFTPVHTKPHVSCFSCGRPMESNPLGKCNECVATSIDITGNAQKEGELVFCKDCGRVHCPPRQWVSANRESKELLALLVRRLDLGGPDVRLTDAQFLWTEPHSRRTKLRLTLQQEVTNVLLEQSYDVEFFESTQQCPQCAKSYTHNKWVANVQIRQHVPHKKTILWLEQIMLRSANSRTISSIEESREGIDLHFAFQRDAEKMVSFLQSHAPIKLVKSSQLVSQDTHTAKSSYKFTYSIEIAPICREDLVVLPKKVSNSKGGIQRLLLCYKLNNSIHFVDPNTCKTTFLNSGEYWKNPFVSVASARGPELTEFFVMDVEPTGEVNGKFVLADVTIAKPNEMGEEILIRTHLGAILHEGDSVLGYDLRTAQYNNDEWDSLDSNKIPEVVLVKKVYPEKPKNKKRQVKRLVAEYNDGTVKPEMGDDYNEFLEEMEYMSDMDIEEEV